MKEKEIGCILSDHDAEDDVGIDFS